MYKKLSVLMAALLILPATAYGNTFTPDGHVEYDDIGNYKADVNVKVFENFNLKHTQARISKFVVQPGDATIDPERDITLATLKISNNTRDGFKVVLYSASGGNLLPTSGTDDGEAAIPYGLAFSKTSGDKGTGITEDPDLIMTDADLAAADETLRSLLRVTGGSVSTPTEVSYDMSVTVHSDYTNNLSMAGTYEDTLTIEYVDL